MIEKRPFDFPIVRKVHISIRKKHHLNLTKEKVKDFFFSQFKQLSYNELEVVEKDSIIFTNDSVHFFVNRYKNQFSNYNYGEIKFEEDDDYWIITFTGEMKRFVVKSIVFFFIILLINISSGITILGLITSLILGFLYFIIGLVTSKFRIRSYLMRRKIELETWR